MSVHSLVGRSVGPNFWQVLHFQLFHRSTCSDCEARSLIQESQIDIESPIMDPAVVMVQGGRKPDQVARQSVGGCGGRGGKWQPIWMGKGFDSLRHYLLIT